MQIMENVTEAASASCFPPEIVLALVSRLSIQNGSFIESNNGWRPCTLQSSLYNAWDECYGLMHVPRSQGANDTYGVDSVEHFINGLSHLIGLTNQITSKFTSYSVGAQTRGAIAAYDAGLSTVTDKSTFFLLFLFKLLCRSY